METKFYVGQRVRSDKFGEGEVSSIDTSGITNINYRIGVKFPGRKYAIAYTLDGVYTLGGPIDLHPIDQPKTTLTEWQRNEIKKHIELTDIQVDRLESILSEPEPPKYIPKHGEAVEIRDSLSDPWLVDVFHEMIDDNRYIGYNLTGKYCRPFDASLVGQITND